MKYQLGISGHKYVFNCILFAELAYVHDFAADKSTRSDKRLKVMVNGMERAGKRNYFVTLQ